MYAILSTLVLAGWPTLPAESCWPELPATMIETQELDELFNTPSTIGGWAPGPVTYELDDSPAPLPVSPAQETGVVLKDLVVSSLRPAGQWQTVCGPQGCRRVWVPETPAVKPTKTVIRKSVRRWRWPVLRRWFR